MEPLGLSPIFPYGPYGPYEALGSLPGPLVNTAPPFLGGYQPAQTEEEVRRQLCMHAISAFRV